VFSRPFQRYITSPQISKISIGKTKEILQSFCDCRAGWSKELQWENDNVFYKCIEGNWFQVGHVLTIGNIYW
jgi:hypothetical protein